MTRARADAVPVHATNNVYTALTGAACAALLIALGLLMAKWWGLVGESGEPKLFFGFFWPL